MYFIYVFWKSALRPPSTATLASIRSGNNLSSDSGRGLAVVLTGTGPGYRLIGLHIAVFFFVVFLGGFFFGDVVAHSRGCSCGSCGFLEDWMMDIITGRAPPAARAESVYWLSVDW